MLFSFHHEWIFFSIISSNWLLLAYRKVIDWYSDITSLISFLNSLIKSMSVSIDSLGCSLDRQQNQLQIMVIFFSLPIVILHFFFASYCVRYRAASNIFLAWGTSTNGGLLTTFQGNMNWNTKRRNSMVSVGKQSLSWKNLSLWERKDLTN